MGSTVGPDAELCFTHLHTQGRSSLTRCRPGFVLPSSCQPGSLRPSRSIVEDCQGVGASSARPGRNLSAQGHRLLRAPAMPIAAIALTGRTAAAVRTAVHPAARLTVHGWRPARRPGPCLRPTAAASGERLGLAVRPLHGVDARFHADPLPPPGWSHWRHWHS